MTNHGPLFDGRKICPGSLSLTIAQSFISERYGGSGKWLLMNEELQAWLKGTGPPLLWLHGRASTGKTFLSTHVLDLIKSTDNLQAGNAAVATVHLNNKGGYCDLVDYSHILYDIARQLADHLSNDSVFVESPQLFGSNSNSESDSIFTFIRAIASEFHHTYIILDGVKDHEAAALRALAVSFCGDNDEKGLIRVLITSRTPPPTCLRDHIRMSSIEISAHKDDLTLHIAAAVRSSSSSSSDDSIIKQITGFADGCRGLFLPLFVPMVSGGPVAKIRHLQNLLPAGSSDSAIIQAYCDAAFEQINAVDSRDLLRCILYHVIRLDELGRIFTLPMAQDAVAAWRLGKNGVPYTASDIVHACDGLISITGSAQFMHIRSPLLADYLGRHSFRQEYDERLIIHALDYLSQDAFAAGACESSGELKWRFQAHRYLSCAAKLLSVSDLSICNLKVLTASFVSLSSRSGCVETFLQAQEAWEFADEIAFDELEEEESRVRCFTRGYHPLHLAAHLVAPSALIHNLARLGEDVMARDEVSRTPLHRASEIDDTLETMRGLLECGSDPNALDESDETPLSIAAVHGSLESVKLLVRYGANTDHLDEEILRECMEERPQIMAYLHELGVPLPEEE